MSSLAITEPAAAEFTRTANLEKALADAPAVRQEAMQRASILLEDPHYPPQETIRRIAQLLAMQWESE